MIALRRSVFVLGGGMVVLRAFVLVLGSRVFVLRAFVLGALVLPRVSPAAGFRRLAAALFRWFGLLLFAGPGLLSGRFFLFRRFA